MEKRLILAITLSVIVVMLFQRFLPKPQQTQPLQQAELAPQTQSVRDEVATQKTILPYEQSITPGDHILRKEKETIIETEKYILTFTNVGAGLKKVVLKEYDSTILNNVSNSPNPFSLSFVGLFNNIRLEIFDLKQERQKLTYSYIDNINSLKIIKEYYIHNSLDYIELRTSFELLSDEQRSFQYNIVGPSYIKQAGKSMRGRNFTEVDAQLDGKLIRKNNIKAQQEIFTGIISWVGQKNRYFAMILTAPDECESFYIKKNNKIFETGLMLKQRMISRQSPIQDSYVFYIGPLMKNRLNAVNPEFSGIVTRGFFSVISDFLLLLLGKINSVVHNWGIAIILVTVIINIVLFPLTKKSFSSMQKMQEIQPHIEKLRTLHKDNNQKLNKEMMGLYKQYNVNPFGGCLPMLLQLPVFISFYQALMHSIELKNAQFLWIKDLSSPDALFTFSQSLPLIGDKLNILPLITVLLMVLQQKITMMSTGKNVSSDMARQQKMMAFFFPIFFGFILYNFPAGLVLYWLTNSLLMTGEQYWLRSKRQIIKG